MRPEYFSDSFPGGPGGVGPSVGDAAGGTNTIGSPSEREGIEESARHVATGWRPVESLVRLKPLQVHVRRAADTLEQELRRLRALAPASISEPIRWLTENHRVIRTAIADVREAVRNPVTDLPLVVLASNPEMPMPRAYAAAAACLELTGWRFDEDLFAECVDAMQNGSAFDIGELWSLRPGLEIALVDELVRLLTELRPAPAEAGRPRGPRGRVSGRRGGAPSTAENVQRSSVGADILVRSLRALADADWKTLIERLSVADRVLRHDPAGAYVRMDFESRDNYRRAVCELATHSAADQLEVALEVLRCASAASKLERFGTRLTERRSHVGYYLVDKGRSVIEQTIRYEAPAGHQLRAAMRRSPNLWYLGGIALLTLAIVGFVLNGLGGSFPLVWAFLLLLVPAAESAIGVMNRLVAFLLPPKPLPRLDFSEGIPEDCRTLVAVPTLLGSEAQVREAVRDLEIRFLGNRDPHLHFALLTDPPDAQQRSDHRDSLAGLCASLVEDLNRRYGASRFFLLHRNRVYNPTEGRWMGWERKRGKLLDLNNLLRGGYDSFPTKVGDLSVLPKVRYVITLDADTQLPRDSAHRLVGTMAHPLNRAVVDPSTNTVVEGYGILQPRIGISVHSANRSRLANIYSGQSGFDIYTRAVSDVYQDLMGEGSFTGKGIYEVDVFRQVLSERFPLNVILSHDLIEGAYARAGLVSDIELIDDYPSHFSAYSRRKHRWIRGDWQIMRWLLPRVPDATNRLVPNPISVTSRWKILDNLRRSLVEVATFVLLLAGWFYLPGGPDRWTVAVLALLLVPAYVQLVLSLVRVPAAARPLGVLRDVADGFVADQLSVFMLLAFLAHQVLVTLDAIVRTIIRLTITHRRLLEWETAADSETRGGRRTPVDRYFDWSPAIPAAIAVLLLIVRADALPAASPVLVLWAVAPILGGWLDRPLRLRSHLTSADERDLRRTAVRTWRFFDTFSHAGTNWLIPDHVLDDPRSVIRVTSPTNIGLLLNARMAACELGYLTLPELVEQTSHTLATVRQLAQYGGHLLNWYDTTTLQPLDPLFVSTVDSGNFACALWALKQWSLAAAKRPPTSEVFWRGLLDHLHVLDELCRDAGSRLSGSKGEALHQWIDRWENGPAAESALANLEGILSRLQGAATEPETADDTLGEVVRWCEASRAAIDRVRSTSPREPHSEISAISASPREPHLATSASPGEPSAFLRDELARIADEADALVRDMDFGFLYNERRKVLSIGFDVARQQLEVSCYELLASEARAAALVAIAKNEIPQESWFHLGRTLTIANGRRVLISWSGTMFEYLMPGLWMKSFRETLLDETLRSAVIVQQRTRADNSRPWGISESACADRNAADDYRYAAFGLSALAMRPDAERRPVISPYASMLALTVDPAAAVENLRLMESCRWSGEFGLYEAADFAPSENGRTGVGRLVKSWMAHHQGMILVSIGNLLADGAIQRAFHAEPMVVATERLLQERLPRTIPASEAEE